MISEPDTLFGPGAQLLQADASHAVASLEHLLMSAWREPAPGSISRFTDCVRQHCATHREPVAVLRVMPGTAPPPDAARVHLADLFVDVSDRLAALVIIGEGGGFCPAAHRAAASSLRLQTGAAFPVLFVSSVEDSLAEIARSGHFRAPKVAPHKILETFEWLARQLPGPADSLTR